MIGFVDLGDINNHLLEIERSLETDSTAKSTTLASSVMVIMQRCRKQKLSGGAKVNIIKIYIILLTN